jgi:hypothetical protein
VGKSLEVIDTEQNFLNRASMAYAIRSRTDKWDLMKLESFCKPKDIAHSTNQQPTHYENFSLNGHPIED